MTCRIQPEKMYILSNMFRNASELRIPDAVMKYLLPRNIFKQITVTTMKYENDSNRPIQPMSKNERPYMVETASSSVISTGFKDITVSSETILFDTKSGRNSSSK